MPVPLASRFDSSQVLGIARAPVAQIREHHQQRAARRPTAANTMWNASEIPICARANVKPVTASTTGFCCELSPGATLHRAVGSSMLPWLALVALVAGSPEFLKGQLHLHTGNSGDSTTPPADVVRWYAARGYDFIVVTDHNFVTAAASTPAMLVIPGVELTQNVDRCAPPPPSGMRCLLHVNALFVDATARREDRVGRPRGAVAPAALPARAGDHARAGRHRAAQSPQLPLRRRRRPDHHAGGRRPDADGDRQSLLGFNDVPADRGRPSTEALWDRR